MPRSNLRLSTIKIFSESSANSIVWVALEKWIHLNERMRLCCLARVRFWNNNSDLSWNRAQSTIFGFKKENRIIIYNYIRRTVYMSTPFSLKWNTVSWIANSINTKQCTLYSVLASHILCWIVYFISLLSESRSSVMWCPLHEYILYIYFVLFNVFICKTTVYRTQWTTI